MIPKFTISVLCHNRLELTQACIASIFKHSSDYELIVTDNASTDGTAQFLGNHRSLFDAVKAGYRVITNLANKGFNEPNNHTLTLARGEFLVLLNNDMVVCEGWLERLVAPFTTNPKLAITGIGNTCGTIGANLTGTVGQRLDYIEGSCLMIPTALARKHGLFSDYLSFAYWEDTDLSLRLREKGYEITTVNLPMNHGKRGSTTAIVPEAKQHLTANTEIMKKKYGFYFKRHTLDRRILVRRLGAHGDVLLATPALRALREKYPQAHVEVVTKCPTMLHGLDWVKLAHHPRSWYDEFHDLDLAYEKRPEVHIVQAYADVLGVKLAKYWKLEMVATPTEMAWAEKVCRGHRVALVHPGPTCWSGKNWDLGRFKEVVGALRKKGYLTMTVGGEDAPEIGSDIHLGGQTTPQGLYAVCKFSSLFVGIDSMPQHVASAADCPGVILFGPTNPRAIMRPTPRIVAVQADQTKVLCVGEHGRRTKPVTQAPCLGCCMDAITVEMVLKGVARVEALTA